MNYNSHLETNRFKVKQAKKFKDFLEKQYQGGRFEVDLDKSGVAIFATNWFTRDKFNLEEYIQNNLQEGSVCEMKRIGMNAIGEEIRIALSVIKAQGFLVKNQNEILADMVDEVYPKQMISKETTYHEGEGVWIQEGSEYLVLEQSGDLHYIVQHENGKRAEWHKEYFYE